MLPSVYLNVALGSVFKWLKGVFPQHHHKRLLRGFEARGFFVIMELYNKQASQKYDLYSVISIDQS